MVLTSNCLEERERERVSFSDMFAFSWSFFAFRSGRFKVQKVRHMQGNVGGDRTRTFGFKNR